MNMEIDAIRDRREPKYKKALRHIKMAIKELSPGNNALETEEKLATRLGMSRATIRQATDEMIQQGFITRIQGKGMFGHPQVDSLKMRVDMDSNFRDHLTRSGYRVSVTQSQAEIKPASKEMLRKRPEFSETMVYSFQWSYYADETPAIICRIEIPMDLVIKPMSELPSLTLKDTLKDICNLDFSYTIAWLRAVLDKKACDDFNLAIEAPLLVWDEYFYDLFDNLICYNEIFFHPEIMDMSMINNF